MNSPHLVAMIPVVEAVAREQKTRSNPDGWAMPYRDLRTRLAQRTQGRILTGDGTPSNEAAAFAATDAPFTLLFDPQDTAKPLWVELSIDLKTKN